MLVIENLRKSFDQVHAVDDLSIEVGRGEVFGLIGPNGAGKTTTLRMIIQMIKPDAGRILIGGRELLPDDKDRIGYLPEERGLYQRATVKEIVLYLAALKGVPHKAAATRLSYWLDRLGVAEAMHRRCQELSKGNQQKIQLIAALLHDPELLIIDEPFSGLDPINQVLVRDVLAELGAGGKTVVLSAHQMDHIEKMCSRICLIHHGRSVAYDSVDNLKKHYDDGRVRIYGPEADVDKWIASGLLQSVRRCDGGLEGQPPSGLSFADLLRHVGETAQITRIEQMRPNLEDIFVRLVQ